MSNFRDNREIPDDKLSEMYSHDIYSALQWNLGYCENYSNFPLLDTYDFNIKNEELYLFIYHSYELKKVSQDLQ